MCEENKGLVGAGNERRQRENFPSDVFLRKYPSQSSLTFLSTNMEMCVKLNGPTFDLLERIYFFTFKIRMTQLMDIYFDKWLQGIWISENSFQKV